MPNFFKVFRKYGFLESLTVLSSFEGNEAKQSLFFKTLRENGSYLNSFFRVKESLIKSKLISYKLNGDNDKVIFLTEKGKMVHQKIIEIENLLSNKKK
ncbi:MAG: hypothetical protein ACTSWY_14610 [Promethearchaeota archaeon]